MTQQQQPSLFEHRPILLEFKDRSHRTITITTTPEGNLQTSQNHQLLRTETPERTQAALTAAAREHPPYIAFGPVVINPKQAPILLNAYRHHHPIHPAGNQP